MPAALTIAIDAMSGDRGPATLVPATLDLLAEVGDLSVVLVGRPDAIEPHLARHRGAIRDRVRVQEAPDVIAMDDPPAEALRRKRKASMRVAIDLLRDGEVHACVSAGNTGALMAIARFVLKMLPGVDRPAIISAIPAVGGHTHMLDLGANSSCTARQLCEFAVMGSVVATDVHGLERPRIGLLNIGTEEIKGNDTLKLAHQWLRGAALNYVGFVEGTDIMSGAVDVVVTDGFTGNVSLKTIEGAARMLVDTTRRELGRNLRNRMLALAARPLLRDVAARLDPGRYNGASLVGLNGIVIKSHGGADGPAFANAVKTAILEARKGVPTQISRLLADQPFLEQAV